MNRRQFISHGGAALATICLQSQLRAQTVITADPPAFGDVWPAEVAATLQTSSLIYLSPIRLTGELSRCQAEVWFVVDGADVLVVTDSKAWRARALEYGLNTARFWVGDVGVAAHSAGRYLALPRVDTIARYDYDAVNHERALELFGEKYKTAWTYWSHRFRRGLAEGTRTMIRYSYGS